jgi:hypothetical protein
MPKGPNPAELRRLARLGAQARLAELDQERAAILRLFPELGRGGAPAAAASQPAPAAPVRQRRPLTPAERRAISERMKAYWAARRKAAAKKA